MVDGKLYTLDQGIMIRTPVEPITPDIERLIRHHAGKYQFKGHTYLGLPVFFFEETPPDDELRGIRWVELYEEC